MQLLEGGLAVRHTKTSPVGGGAFALAAPALRSGTASASFKIDHNGYYAFQLGVFPADQRLDSSTFYAAGKELSATANPNSYNRNPKLR